MRESIRVLLDRYQVRKTVQQKQAFQEWLTAHMSENGYEIKEQVYSKTGKNLVIGDVETADVVLSAHYDTPPHSIIPLVSFSSGWGRYILGQIVLTLPIMFAYCWVLISIGVTIGSFFRSGTFGEPIQLEVVLTVFAITILVWAFQLMKGFANKHNANDNTSGVATLVAILEDLPAELRQKVCVVFFDEEEKGLKGSQGFLKAHEQIMKTKPVINFDCVANGEHLLFSAKKPFLNSKLLKPLETALAQATGTKRQLVIGSSNQYVHPSDNWTFKNSVGVGSLHKKPFIGYYLKDIHNGKDTIFDTENIEILAQGMVAFMAEAHFEFVAETVVEPATKGFIKVWNHPKLKIPLTILIFVGLFFVGNFVGRQVGEVINIIRGL